MIVFICSGLWHGAAWHYVAWGGINGIYCIMEDAPLQWTKPFFEKGILANKVFRRIITFVLIDITWIFFRSPSFTMALHILKKIIDDLNIAWLINFGYVSVFENAYTMAVIMTSILIVLMVDVTKYHEIDLKSLIFKQDMLSRWIIYAGILLVILYWGNYGTEHQQTQFIYFQF